MVRIDRITTRMKTLAVCLLVLAAGCFPHPITFGSTTADATSGIFDCVKQKVTGLGYLVSDDERLSGYLVADRKRESGWSKVVFGRSYTDRLRVTVDRPDSVPRKLIVRVSGFKHTQLVRNSAKSHATDRAFADADSVLTACGRGVLTKKVERH